MDPRERYNDPEEALRAAILGILAGTWCGGPGIIEAFNATTQTATVQPAVMAKWRKKDGTLVDLDLPLLLDVPVQFPSGGGFTLTFPVVAGDEVYFAVADRCIDAWWQNGDVQPQAELRMHDLSDAFAFLGFRSKPRLLANVSTTAAQLRADTGSAVITVQQDEIDIVANKVRIHGNLETIFEANGTGFRYKPGFIDTYTDGVPGDHHAPNPPEIPF